MPATESWSDICSGVSIVWWSGRNSLGIMVSIAWIEKRRPHWERLEHLVGLASRGLANLAHGELQELGLLYRQTASDLSVVLQDSSSQQLAASLNHLLGRSHNIVYSARRASASGVVDFYPHTYPRIFRETL